MINSVLKKGMLAAGIVAASAAAAAIVAQRLALRTVALFLPDFPDEAERDITVSFVVSGPKDEAPDLKDEMFTDDADDEPAGSGSWDGCFVDDDDVFVEPDLWDELFVDDYDVPSDPDDPECIADGEDIADYMPDFMTEDADISA